MIVVSNYSHYHTPYQVQGIFEADNKADVLYYNAVNPKRISRICRDVPNSNIHNLFWKFFPQTVCRKINIANGWWDEIADDKYENLVIKGLQNINEIEIFHAFNCSALKTMDVLPNHVIKIVECGVHPQTYQNYCLEEYEKLGVTREPLSTHFIEKSIEEFKRADYILTISKICVDSFASNCIPEKKIILLPIASNLKGFERTQKRNERFTILFVGRVTVLKGVQYLVDACRTLLSKGYDIECWIVGPITDEYMKTMSREDYDERVKFMGAVPPEKLPFYYSAASVFIMPSVIDSFCMSVYESMACGTPVIVSDRVGATVHHGRDGFVYPFGDIDAMIESIVKFYDNRDLIEEYGASAKIAASARGWREYGSELLNLYNSLKRNRV